jgi:hypothetical protein
LSSSQLKAQARAVRQKTVPAKLPETRRNKMPSLDSLDIPSAFASHLQPDEKLEHWGYGIRQSILLFLVIFFGLFIVAAFITLILVGSRVGCFGSLIFYLIICLLAIPITPLIRKDYILGLTNNRLLLIQVKPPIWFKPDLNIQKEFIEYSRENLPPISISLGLANSVLKINDPQRPFWARFPRAWKGNRDEIEAIAIKLGIIGN